MRVSRYILPTLKEDPTDAVVLSHRLMMRAGLIKKESAGMYAYLPLGLKVLHKVKSIIREEMNKAEALECLMPELTNADYWKESGRWDNMGAEMFRIQDRNGLEYSLGPTHEEAFTNMIRSVISSYRDLPLNVYQINTKFRDEIRPRFGVIRSKEFIMKDAYSFDMDKDGLDKSYNTMALAYRRIFERCGLDTISVQADSGTMGGSTSEEFMVASEVGEEILLLCHGCDYRANREKAKYKREVSSTIPDMEELKEVYTPNMRTIEALADFFKCDRGKLLKSIIYMADGNPLMVVVPGDRDVNEHKLAAFLKVAELELAKDSIVEDLTGAPVGFAGPVTDRDIRIIFDISVKNIFNAVTGANEQDKHLTGVNPERDFRIKESCDITSAKEGDICDFCGSELYEKKGIEVGHIFKLGYKYTESMKVKVLDENGKSVTPIMGCYGIGVNRTIAAIVEQNNDERGIIWPKSVSPFQVHLIGIAKKDEDIKAVDGVYKKLIEAGIDVLYDDRKASPGVKFADADLIGIPLRITMGRSFFERGEFEFKERNKKEIKQVPGVQLIEKIKTYI